jgi:apolipoprotein N-acyltransferase
MGFPDLGWWPAAAVGVTLLVLALRRDSVRTGAAVGFLWGLAFFLPHLHWLYVSVGTVPWIALSVVEAAFVAGVGAAWVVIRRAALLRGRPLRQALVFAALWVVGEELRSAVPFGGFPWGRLAFSQADSPLLALAALGGAPLVSAAVAVGGALLAAAWTGLRAGRPGAGAPALVAAGAVVGLALILPLPATGTGSQTLSIAAVQGNVARPGLDAFATRREVLRTHVDGTRALLQEVAPGELDLVLWPENASDVDPRVDQVTADLIDGVAREVAAPILVGTLRYDERGRYNDSLLWTPGEGPTALYTKQHPAPFAEYIPLRGLARLFSDKVDLVRTDMLPGTGVGVVPVPVDRLARTVPLADVICFEVAYDGIVREAVRAGGEAIVVQTNNASFGRTPESTQQLAMTRLRAVEHGRTAVQISTVGVSGIVAPDGTVRHRADLFTADRLLDVVPLSTALTPADRLGPWPTWVAAVVTALALTAGIAGTRRRGPRPAGEPAPPVVTGRPA